ncbi:MAG: sulfotransferase [Verrucomicrobiota bacterium]|nr:sulfotransferase [Verrucomicrobiota bacterium]
MNNSGSTLLERLLSDCRNAVGFPPPGGPNEQVNGQGFVPDLMPIPGKIQPQCRRIWSEQAAIFEDESRYDWPKIKRRWREKWALNPKFQTANPRVFLEKSPPNVYRAQMLQKYFPNSFFILMQRNPYAVSEGIRRRAGLSIERCIQHWIRCAKKQLENVQTLRRIIQLSYEQLSEQPELSQQRIIELIPELDDLDIRKDVVAQTLEGQLRQPIINYNAKQIALLSPDDLAAINHYLDEVPKVMAHFGYEYVQSKAEDLREF